ncbi:damage-inducible protein CinA [Bifidobacterium tissieri]|uniref:Damage-inducible protein CinA n=1 Tax=Bifidobacterium tissieri TaxID=1630162 RepID=A0A261F8W9_9BIFI|nr:CinA family protein [Bifidobacterium tissieri]OZG55600.1 damage-inducible protein CinA [Bifidobacterium tissieri]
MSPDSEARERRDDLAAQALRICEERSLFIAAAESLTGGLLADAFVRIPGASKVFLGSAVTYDIHAKAGILGVDSGLLEREGAVHPQVAMQMARDTAKLYTTLPEYRDRVVGLATTGVAGPGPDGDKPAGLVYIGLSLPCDGRSGESTVEARELHLSGTRGQVRLRTVEAVLERLNELLG